MGKEKRSGKILHEYCIHKNPNPIEIKLYIFIIAMEICWAPQNQVQGGEAAAEPMGNADDDIICYEAEYKVLICRQHQYAVRNLHDHLRDKHTTIGIEQRRAIVEEHMQHELQKPGKVRQPPALGPPIPALGQPVKALQCSDEACGHISINRKTMQQHCNRTHGWRHSTADPKHWNRVHVQTFFTSGGFRRYFVVQIPGSSNDEHNDERNNENQPARASVAPEDADAGDTAIIRREWADARKKHQRELELADETIAKTDRTGWFNRAGWPEHLAGRNLKHLAHASRLPDRNERALKRACEVVDQAIEQSVAGLASLAHETRRWLRSAKREEIDVRPMARLQNPESQGRYAGYMKWFVCYCLRIAAAARDLDEEEEGSRLLSQDNNRRAPPNSSDVESEDEEKEEEEENPLRDARELFLWHGNQRELAVDMWQALDTGEEDDRTLVLRMLSLLESFIFQTVGNEPFRSPLVHFLAVLGIDEQMGRLRTADNYSFMLAGVVYCVRVLGVEILLPSSQRKHQGEAEREYFLQQRQKFLTDGSYSAMSTMINLLAYSKYITLNKSNEDSVQWSADQRVLYLHGRLIVISRFRRMVQDAITEAEQLLWQGADVDETRREIQGGAESDGG